MTTGDGGGGSSANSADKDDPLLIACARGRERLFVFSRREPTEDKPRDVFNERPRGELNAAAAAAAKAASALARYATIHTTLGDIRCKLFCD